MGDVTDAFPMDAPIKVLILILKVVLNDVNSLHKAPTLKFFLKKKISI